MRVQEALGSPYRMTAHWRAFIVPLIQFYVVNKMAFFVGNVKALFASLLR